MKLYFRHWYNKSCDTKGSKMQKEEYIKDILSTVTLTTPIQHKHSIVKTKDI